MVYNSIFFIIDSVISDNSNHSSNSLSPFMPQVFTSVYINPAFTLYPVYFYKYSCNSLYSCSLNLKQQSRVRPPPCPPSNQCATPPATVYSQFIALRANVQVQHMMERYDYTSRTARLRNRIAIPYHQNSKHESLPTGCLFRFMFFPQAIKTTGFIRAIVNHR